jgi:hypothetical protein
MTKHVAGPAGATTTGAAAGRPELPTGLRVAIKGVRDC